MKKKITMMAWLFLLIAVFCSACGNSDNAADTPQDSTAESTETTETESPEDKKTTEAEPTAKEENLYGEKTLDEIKEDLGTSELMMDFGTDEDYYISDITLIKRNTKEESDNVFCTITVNGDTRQFIQDFELVYNYYTTGGWILDEYTATSEQTIFPLAGVNDSMIHATMENLIYPCEYTIIDHETDLNGLEDIVTVSVTLDKNLYQATGTLLLYYVFGNDSWEKLVVETGDDYTETWNIDGTWIDLDDSDSYFEVIEFWHNDDMTISANYYHFQYIEGEMFRFVINWENAGTQFDQNEGYVYLTDGEYNASFHIDYDNIYPDLLNHPDRTFEKVSDGILSIEDIQATYFP